MYETTLRNAEELLHFLVLEHIFNKRENGGIEQDSMISQVELQRRHKDNEVDFRFECAEAENLCMSALYTGELHEHSKKLSFRSTRRSCFMPYGSSLAIPAILRLRSLVDQAKDL